MALISAHKFFAFVLMPFDSAFDDLYRFGIKEPAAKLGILAQRVDEQLYSEGILERIYRQIEAADIIVADMSTRNENVFYEVGYAHAKDKLCILATSNADDIPFDLKHRRHIVYSSINDLALRITGELEWALTEIQKVRDSQIKVTLKPTFGTLETTRYSATGSANLEIDLVNDSDSESPEISAIYFYSTKDWRVFQNGKECASSDSDLPKFEKRHFLVSPVRTLHKGGTWAQLQFQVQKRLASALQGEILADQYIVRGQSVLRLVTSKGHFDYSLYMKIEFIDIPF